MVNKRIKQEPIDTNAFLGELEKTARQSNSIGQSFYDTYNVKRGLRNRDSTGVLVGLTEIGDVHGYIIDENEKVPDKGRLRYRGIDIKDIVKGCQKMNSPILSMEALFLSLSLKANQIPDGQNIIMFQSHFYHFSFLIL